MKFVMANREKKWWKKEICVDGKRIQKANNGVLRLLP